MKNKALLGLAALTALSGCNHLPDWLGSAEKPKLQGERFSVMEDATKLAIDPSMESEAVDVPEESTQPSGVTNTGNYRLEGNLSSITKVDAGDEPDENFFLSYAPTVAEGTVYVIDGRSNINAYDSSTLSKKWNKETDSPKKDRDLPGGGLSYAYGVLYGATGYGDVLAILAADNSLVWKKNLGAPLRRPPVVQEDKVYATTIDNQLFALSVIDGATLWRHSGVKENTSFYGSANVAVKGDVAVAAYSSGEVFGISTGKGHELWTELVALGNQRGNVASSLNDVAASPVIVDGIVYIGGNTGDFNAFNAANGFRIWQQKTGSVTTTPWVAGKFIFVIAQGNKLAALNRFDGRVKWVSELPKPKEEDIKNVWSGPVMAGGKLVIVGSEGKLLVADPQTGQIVQQIDVPEGIYTAPTIADGKLYMLTRKAELVQVK